MLKQYTDFCATCAKDIPDDTLAIRQSMLYRDLMLQLIANAKSGKVGMWLVEYWNKHRYVGGKMHLQCESCANWEMPTMTKKEAWTAEHIRIMSDYDADEYRRFFDGTDYIGQQYPRPCDGCGRPLVAMGVNVSHVCSDRCAAKLRRGSMLNERRCDKCHHKYMPKRKDSKFCSTKCRVASHRANKPLPV